MEKNRQRIYPHIKKGRFYNYPNETPERFLFRSFVIYLKSFINRLFYHPVVADWRVDMQPLRTSATPAVTWIGHSTFLIQADGINVLTDPIFGDATSLFPRIIDPGLTLSQLPRIDYVLISHNHLDHMDASALTVIRNLNPQCRFLVPLGDKPWFDRRGFLFVEEHTWWQDSFFENNGISLRFTFLPAYHWTQRGIFDKNRSLWGSWMLQFPSCKIYFAGDTAYAGHFRQIGREFGPIDCALMPIGPCEPHSWMKYSHVNAFEAFQGFKDLQARHFIPMHWGTFYFGTDTFDMPMQMLQEVWEQKQDEILLEELHILRVGERLMLPESTVPYAQDVEQIQELQ